MIDRRLSASRHERESDNLLALLKHAHTILDRRALEQSATRALDTVDSLSHLNCRRKQQP